MSALSEGFEDFELHIAAERGDGVYPITVIESSAGQSDGEFQMPMSAQELEAALERMQALDTDEATLTNFGTRLFSALFQGAVHSRYAESVGIAKDRKGLRIRLRIVPPELAALPWELLYDPEKEEFLSLSKRALITRYLHVPRPISPLQAQLPLRILVAIASPQDLERLDGEAEVKKIEKALAEPVAQNLIQYDILRNTTTRDLRDALMKPYHVLHFIGHGAFEEGTGSLAFEDSDGNATPVSGRTLGTLLKSSSVRLVVLNACESAQNTTNTQAFTGVGPALVEAGIPAVVAMQFVVGDDSARTFAQDFYGMLSFLLPVDECISRVREGLMVEAGISNVDWATPVLFLRAPDGIIFTPEGVDRIEDETLEEAKGVYLGDLTTARRTPAKTDAELPQQKELISHLWAMVDCPTYRRWAEPHEARSRWVTRYEEGYVDELAREAITVVADREPVSVILGEAGMGKTANLERLAFYYAEQTLRSEGDGLIPVFVKLSQYGGEDSLVPLVRTGLNRHGQLCLTADKNDAQTQTLLLQHRFVILLSGLHHLPGDETKREQGIAVVNRFLSDYAQHKYVISCRTSFFDDHFREHKAWAILPHSEEDVRAHFIRRLGEKRGEQYYQSLPDRMRAMARTPLLLSLLLEEFRDRGDKAAMQRGPLFAHLVSRMLSQEQTSVPVQNQQAFLTRLAFAMKQDQTLEYTRDRSLEIIGEEMSKARLWETAPQRVLDELIASGLLRTGSTAQIAFAHPWFQDYFAAIALHGKLVSGDVDWETLAGDYWWHDAILFLVNLAGQPAPMIRQLLPHDPLLAARCLLETEIADDSLHAEIGEALAEREKVGTETERERATELLTDLHAAGIVSDVVHHRQAVDARVTDETVAKTTSLGLSVRGHLVVTKGPLAGLRFPLMDGTISVGRSRSVNITVRDKSVSRRHAEIKIQGTEVAIRDVGSTNGTRINGRQITDWYQLQDGDEIQLGDLVLTLDVQK